MRLHRLSNPAVIACLYGALACMVGVNPLSAASPGDAGARDIQGEFTFFQLPLPNFMPVGLAFDSNGMVYVAGYEANAVLQLDPRSGDFREFPIPTPESGPWNLAVDSQDRVWYAGKGLDWKRLMGSKIGRIDPANGEVVEIEVPTPFSGPHTMSFDSQGRLWFTQIYGNKVAEYNPETGQFTEHEVRSDVPPEGFWPRESFSAWPQGLAVDADDNIWFALNRANKVVMLHPPSRTMIEYSPRRTGPSGQAGASLVRDPDGFYSGAARVAIDLHNRNDVWFTIPSQNTLGKIDRETRRIREFVMPTVSSWPLDVAVDRRGRVWVNQYHTDKIAVFDPETDRIDEYPIPGAERPTTCRAIAIDAEGRIWFSDEGQNRIGYLE